MKARHLRIGNWVYVRTNGNYEQVKDIHDNFGGFVDGIPLTDKWLIDFGYEPKFEDEEDNLIFIKDGLEITKHCFEQEFWIDANTVTPRRIKYVHQLQNLHFALTGKELNKKQKPL